MHIVHLHNFFKTLDVHQYLDCAQSISSTHMISINIWFSSSCILHMIDVDHSWLHMTSHGPSASSLYLPFTTALVPRRQAFCLPFTFAWSIAAKSCLSFTILPYKTILYATSLISSLPHYDHHMKFGSNNISLVITNLSCSSFVMLILLHTFITTSWALQRIQATSPSWLKLLTLVHLWTNHLCISS